ncbi:NAD(P)/FAD-dependent oxidoreductase [Gordonia aichiensis]|uniref:Gamma-glutamylputrescine oxidoreductase n=1 Tax=Gordonia aichiensis NBRC 108223 TaxID=1220583 RepID=L7KS10_9ACTN|nr:FAD-binding oxidoreductase [Gordonia aichiensis]GAC50747.1 gamma-glutamylputrescine oxidoreductase [Gordonia aichiensis NBRC 108223]
MSKQNTPPTYYALDLVTPERPALTGTHTYDAVVVGAGYAGISAATTFAESGMSVVVLEKDYVAAGASGRNGGILLLSEGTHLGDADESAIVDESLGAAAAEFVTFIEDNGIDADLRRGSIRLAITKRQAAQLAQSAAAGSAEARAGRTYLDRDALTEHLQSDRYVAGLLERDNINLNPHKLLEGLAAHAERLGVVIAEQSTVTGVRTSRGAVTVSTGGGEVHAERLVVATGTGTGQVVPRIRDLLFTGYSQIAVTEPIPQDTLDAVLPSWYSTSEIATFSRYFRRLPDNRLLFGISTLFDTIAGPGMATQIRAELRDTFPSLGDAPFQSAWEGAIASTVEETPLLERIAPSAVVTSSNGVLASWNAGRIAAVATAPEYAAYDLLRGNRHTTWPPLHLPDRVVRTGARGYFKIKDRL